MKKTFLILIIGSILLSCGKGGEIGAPKKDNGGINQFISFEEIRSNVFTSTEKNLAKALCDSLQYRNANFFQLYGATKKFKFNVDIKECGKVEESGKSSYQYKLTNNVLSFNQLLGDGGPVITPVVEIDNLGSYKDYCDVRNNALTRYFGNDQDFKYFVFYEGGDCPVDAICSDLRIVQGGIVTFSKKIRVMNNPANNQFGYSIRGQEIGSETYLRCSENETGTQFFTLDSILNI